MVANFQNPNTSNVPAPVSSPQPSPQPSPLPQPSPSPITWQGFRIASVDQNGHSETITFRCQPGHARQASSVIAMRIWPYRDMGDLIRHALERHLKFLDSMAPIPSVTKQVDAILEILRDEEFKTDFNSVFERLGQQVAYYVGIGSEREARALVARVKQYIEDMPQGDWKLRYQEELENKFQHLMDNAKPIRLMDWTEEDV